MATQGTVMAEGSMATQFMQSRAQGSKPAGFAYFHFRLLRGAICAWHSTMLLIALMGELLDMAMSHLGTGMAFMPWAHGYRVHGSESIVVACATIALLIRGTLCAVSWSRSSAGLYLRIAPALVLVGHMCATVAFSYAVFSGRQGYVVLVSLQVFAASILSGLSLRQSLYVNAASLVALALAALMLGVPMTMAVPIIYAILLCCVMSGVAASALERSSHALYDEHNRISDLAVLDGLTGLKNRHAFNTHLPEVWQVARQERRTLTLLLVDVDYFKAYNDTRGHVAGDQALRAIARAIGDVAYRPTDFVARYGGDEIAVVLLDATADSVIKLTSRMHAAVSRLGLTLQDNDPGRRVTLSTGVAHLRPEALHGEEASTYLMALQMADQALYAAKRAGRNRFALLTEAAGPGVAGVYEPERLLQIA